MNPISIMLLIPWLITLFIGPDWANQAAFPAAMAGALTLAVK